jgi:hypothetical protein
MPGAVQRRQRRLLGGECTAAGVVPHVPAETHAGASVLLEVLDADFERCGHLAYRPCSSRFRIARAAAGSCTTGSGAPLTVTWPGASHPA